ncbi:MAG TPA: hypothetical protein VEG28_02345 [Dehalococcoidia bacterium]|nr:hypothetical protein [Dehalococcoidia bacterium]
MTEEKNLQLLVRVMTVGGQTTDHRYILPSDNKKAEEFVEKLANMIARAMAPKTSQLVWFDSPMIVYNPDNILGIRANLVGSEHDKTSFDNQLKAKLGLI